MVRRVGCMVIPHFMVLDGRRAATGCAAGIAAAA
jgi:hypothetical protein